MSRVSYQAMLEGAAAEAGDYVALPKEAVATRRKDAKRNVRVRVSDAQRRWLEEVTEMSGRGVDEGAILRALLDVGMSLDVDWPFVAGGRELRESVRDAIRVRQSEVD
jgi:hypothetical protein